MRKLSLYALVFSLGFLVCLLVLRSFGGYGPASAPVARRAALEILDRKPVPGPVQDSAIVQAAAHIEPAVVNIDTLVTWRTRAYEFFGPDMPFAYEGKGSGVIISPDGYIVTNNHVIEGAKIIKVTMSNGTQFDGRVIGRDA